MRKVFRELNEMLSPEKTQTFHDYDYFVKTGSSLMVGMIIMDDDYEEGCYLPPHLLEFDLGGALVIDNNTAVLEWGEVKSSSSRMFL